MRDVNTQHSLTAKITTMPLCDAAAAGNVGILKQLLDAGALINLEGNREGTPFISACACGRLEIAECLVKVGASIRYEKYGRTVSALHAAK